MTMKIGKVSALAIMMMGLAGCVKEISPLEEPQAEGVEFSIFASTQSETKTEYSDDGHITWSAVDTMNVFHKGKGSYVNNYPFTVSDAATGKFDGRLKEALYASTSYKWFAVYPYDSEATSPEAATVRIGAAAGKAQAQTGDDSRLHLVGTGHPLYGTAATTGVQAPELTMHQAASIIGIKVKNETGTPLKVGEVTFTAPEAIVGDFTMDITGSEPAFTSTSAVSQTARLTVTDASTLTQDAEATYFLTIKPFTATSGAILKLSVNGYEKTITLTKDVIFHPGKIKTIGFGYNAGYQLVTKEPSDWSGKYLVVSKDKSSIFTGATSTSNKESLSDVDFDGDMIVKSGLEAYEFTITKEDENYYLQNGEYYVYCSGSADTKIGRSISEKALKSDGFESDGSFVLWGTYGATQYLYFNGTNFKFGSSGKGVLLYKYSGSIPVVKKDRNLAFSQEEVSKTFGDTAFTNALNGNTEGVTYISSEPSVATVDAASGQVTIVGAGTATITATAEATNSLKAGSAEFTLTVAKAAQTISFSKTSVDFDMATGTFTAPTLSGAKTAVTYASNDANVATVNASTGAVTIKSVGTVTITATAAESANYTSATASYTINVTKSELVGYYKKVTADSQIKDGGKYVIVYESGDSAKVFKPIFDGTSSYTEGEASNAVSATITNSMIADNDSLRACQIVFELKKNSSPVSYYTRVPKANGSTDYYFMLYTSSGTFKGQTGQGYSSIFSISNGVLTMSRTVVNSGTRYMSYSNSSFSSVNAESASTKLALYEFIEGEMHVGPYYEKVNALSQVEDNGKYIIVYEDGSNSKVFKPIRDNNNNRFVESDSRNAISVVSANSQITASEAINECQIVLELKSGTNNSYYMRVPSAGSTSYFALYDGTNTFVVLGSRSYRSDFSFTSNGALTIQRTMDNNVTKFVTYSVANSYFMSSDSESNSGKLALYKYVE